MYWLVYIIKHRTDVRAIVKAQEDIDLDRVGSLYSDTRGISALRSYLRFY